MTLLTVNLILFEPIEIDRPLPRGDRRAQHILTVLRRSVGDSFDVGLIDGPRGKGTLTAMTAEALVLAFIWEPAAPSLPALTLIIGLPRPQTARDILRDATTLGATALHFTRTEKSDPNYAQSTLWSSGEWRRHVIAGAEQAFATQVPVVTRGQPLAQIVAALAPGGTRLALDNYEGSGSLGGIPNLAPPVTLAIGPERGWSASERDLLRTHAFECVHLGTRVLRTETACIAALSLVRAKLGLM
jgi:RsmE family RNA methyltransferase